MSKTTNEMESRLGIFRNQLLTVGDFDNFKSSLLDEIRNLLQQSNGQPAKQWLKSIEVRKLLGISPGTLQNLRMNGSLPFTKIGGIVFYRYDDLAKLLNQSGNGK